MTRKDFILIAAVVRNAPGADVRELLAERFANVLQCTNPHFDRDRFIRAATEGK